MSYHLEHSGPPDRATASGAIRQPSINPLGTKRSDRDLDEELADSQRREQQRTRETRANRYRGRRRSARGRRLGN
jgi:hypothetical protein